jgi:CxxC motif-containing protein (DUF1111 family)
MARYRFFSLTGLLLLLLIGSGIAQTGPALTAAPTTGTGGVHDPGVQPPPPNAGNPLPNLNLDETTLFTDAKAAFEAVEAIADGLGPRFNLNSCGGCHAFPTTGGTSPSVNPEFSVGTQFGNQIPFFITPDGPAREVRFKFNPDGSRDGSVHNLFVIQAPGCMLQQPNFAAQAAKNNLIFRIPTPTFGLGLIEQIADSTILANMQANQARKSAMGISGHPHLLTATANRAADATISRFGWKAQNKSGLMFSGEAYNVEMGITNELFQTEREENPSCQFAPVPNDTLNPGGTSAATVLADIDKFAFFMRVLAPLEPNTTSGSAASVAMGRAVFQSVGCSLCHTPAMTTGNTAAILALRNQTANLFSDLLLHNMGPGLADDIVQGGAGPDEFRTAPLWGLGQRIFLLHDGRTTDLVEAIQAHRSPPSRQFIASEANAVINAFDRLSPTNKQNLLNFLRSL